MALGGTMKTVIRQDLLAIDEASAFDIRMLLQEKNVLMLHLLSSSGAGKTALLESTIDKLQHIYHIAVIEGDMATNHHVARLERFGIPISQVHTGGAYHVNSVGIAEALTQLDLDMLDIIFVENLGGCIYPEEFDIGEHAKVALMSVSQGDDKVLKYPSLFRQADLIILNKIDLIEANNFNKKIFYDDVMQINPDASVLEISCKHDSDLEEWLHWIHKVHAAKR